VKDQKEAHKKKKKSSESQQKGANDCEEFKKEQVVSREMELVDGAQ
jgi:hypothetical protein